MKHLYLSPCLRYVFHSAGILPDPSFVGRVEYFGQPGTNNCSLRISELRQSDSGTYVFYLITDHPTEKMPDQSGIQLLVAGRRSFTYRSKREQYEMDVDLKDPNSRLWVQTSTLNLPWWCFPSGCVSVFFLHSLHSPLKKSNAENINMNQSEIWIF